MLIFIRRFSRTFLGRFDRREYEKQSQRSLDTGPNDCLGSKIGQKVSLGSFISGYNTFNSNKTSGKQCIRYRILLNPLKIDNQLNAFSYMQSQALEKQQREEEFLHIIERLDFFKKQTSTRIEIPSDATTGSTTMASFVAGIADRIAGDRGIAQIIAELGPSSTRSASTLRDVLADFSRTSGPLNEASLASLCLFFSSAPQQTEVVGLSPALLGSIVPGRGQDSNNWNLDVVMEVLSDDYAAVDWNIVATKWDVPTFKMNDTSQFRRLLDLYRAGAKHVPPLSAFTREWANSSGQLSALEAILSVPPTAFPIMLNEEEQDDAAVGMATTNSPHPHCWASAEFLQRLLTLSDNPALYRRIRDQFIRCLTSCPEVLLCSLVRLQLRLANSPDSAEATNAGIQIKTELMRELIPLFFRPSRQRIQNGAGAVRRLYTISPTTVMAACFEAYRSTLTEQAPARHASINHIVNIARHLPNPTEAVANLLSGSRDMEYSIAVALVMADSGYLQLNPWLSEKLSKSGSVTNFAASLISYLRKNYVPAGPKSELVLLSYENIITSLQLLQSLDQSILSSVITDRTTVGDAIRALLEMCVSTHPSLRNSLAVKSNDRGFQDYYGTGEQAKNEVEELATSYFQKIYTSEQSIAEVVEMLKRFKNSGDKKENEIFASMVHQLFEEYRFFARYPERELRITGILFGALIQEQLVTSITLGVALRYVLEALRKPPPPLGNTTAGGGRMFRFGMFALEQFKGRLHEWPQYCSHIVQIPHLKDRYADLVNEIEQEITRGRSSAISPAAAVQQSQQMSNQETRSIGSDTDSLPDPIITTDHSTEKPRIAEFGPGLGRAVTEGVEDLDYEPPDQATLDRVQFLVNNLAPANVESKAAELRGLLEPTYFDWLGQYLVVKRISTQANFHTLYLSFLDNLGDYGRGLVESILNSVYHSIGKLLRSPKITNSSSERGYLKNLGIWLGQITLARNRPIKQILLDCKELLLQGYETGKLIAVAPFLAKTLEGAKNSVVFRPPNPWLVGILGVFRSVYNVEGLKMNIKFEVEVLCKNLSIKLEDIPLKNDVLANRIAPVKERNPDFNVKASASQKTQSLGRYPAGSSQPLATIALPQSSESGRTTPTDQQQDTVIPNLAAYVTVNSSIPQLLQSQQGPLASSLSIASLKRWVPIAVDRAIREIIQPVVERSVNIACLTTKEIVSKDFAMESDETKVRKAGQLMAANLAGSLALVTCREPLRSSVSSHLRQLLASSTGRGDDLSEQEQNVIEQCVQICASDNLELGCKLIEKAATEKAVRDVDEALAQAINSRRQHREQTGQPFYDMSIFGDETQRYPSALPDQLRPTPGGLQPEHFQLYERFQRISRTANLVSQGSSPTETTATSTRSAPHLRGSDAFFETADANQFGPEILNSMAAKLDSAISSLLTVAGTRAREIKLAMLPPDHQICRLIAAVKDIMPNAGPSGLTRQLTASEQEIVLAFSQGIFKRLYELTLSEPLRLESLVALLANVNMFCPKLGKDMGTWATFAPTGNDQQRRLHRTVLLLLVRSRLLAVHDLDSFLAARAENGRNHVWVEFALVFIRTALLERIASTSEFPKIVDLLKKIAEGQSQASPQIAQAVRTPILQILEDNGGQSKTQPAPSAALSASSSKPQADLTSEESFLRSSSLSADSLHSLSDASQKIFDHTEKFSGCDTLDSKKQVATFLEAWIRMYSSDTSRQDKSVGQFLLALQQWGLGKNEEKTERFFRLSAVTLVEAALKSSAKKEDDQRVQINYGAIDLYCKLLHLLFKHMHNGGSQEQVNVQRLAVLNRILGVTVRSMIWHCKTIQSSGRTWDQRPWYRIMLNIIMDFNKPDPLFEPIRLSMLSAFGVAFHACQPLVLPGMV